MTTYRCKIRQYINGAGEIRYQTSIHTVTAAPNDPIFHEHVNFLHSFIRGTRDAALEEARKYVEELRLAAPGLPEEEWVEL